MDLLHATPEQIDEYKNSWIPNGYSVNVKHTHDVKGKDWCRHNLERWMWRMQAFTDENHHTFLFEHKKDADEFSKVMVENIN